MTPEENNKDTLNSQENNKSNDEKELLKECELQISALYDKIIDEHNKLSIIQEELGKTKEWIIASKIEENSKKEIINKLSNLEGKQERDDLIRETSTILELLKNLINKDLNKLQKEVISSNKKYRNKEIAAQIGRRESSKNIDNLFKEKGGLWEKLYNYFNN